MWAPATRIVDILRDFIDAHRLVRELVLRHGAGDLRFRELATLISDGEGSVLFRLKERCHAVFRNPPDGARRPSHREALFDLAVGSLFHEAMKLREDLYQSEVYGPRVRALRGGAGEESKALFDEFEKMLGGVGARLDEGVREVQTLLRQTAEQLRILLRECGDDGTAARFLTERGQDAEEVFGVPLLALLEEMHGSSWEGLGRAGRSYLRSGYFGLAADRFEQALRQPGADPSLKALRAYALGMDAYLARDYRRTVDELGRWSELAEEQRQLLPLARDALSRIGQLAEGSEREDVVRDASLLLESLARAAPEPAGATGEGGGSAGG